MVNGSAEAETAQPTSPAAVDKRVLNALPVGVDLDLAQVTSAAHVMPSQAKTSLRRLVKKRRVEILPDLVAGRPRYRRRQA